MSSDFSQNFNVGGGGEFGSLGSGLVGTGVPRGQQQQISPEYQRAIEAVVHPETLAEWRKAGLDYPLSPEDQEGIRFKLATENSKYHDVAIDQVWRKRIEGQEVLLISVIEWAENEMHNRRSWPHMVGKRESTIFENTYNGLRYVQNRKVDNKEVYYIPFSKEKVEEILSKHNVKNVDTKFYVDVGYTTFGNVTRDDFANMSFEQIHDKYVRGVTLLPGTKFAPPASYTGDLEKTMSIAAKPQSGGAAPVDQTYPGLSAITGKELALLMSVEGGQALGHQIISQVAQSDPNRARDLTAEASKHIQTMLEIQGQQQQHPKQEVTVTKPLITNTADDDGNKPIEEVMTMGENVGFVRTQHDDQGNPIKKTIQDSQGTNIEQDLQQGKKKNK